jgi:hypothetical protein
MDYMGYFDKHKDIQGTYSYDRATLEKCYTDYFSGDIIRVSKLEFKNVAQQDPIVFDYPVFLAPSACQYYHAIVDIVATYESLKILYPNIKIVFCDIDNMVQYKKHKLKEIDYNNDILLIYDGSKIINLFETNVIFNEVLFFPTLSMWYMDRIVPKKIQDSLKEYTHHELWGVRSGYVKHLIDRFKPHIFKKEKEKIYSSRLPYNKILSGEVTMAELEEKTEKDRWFPEEIQIIEYFKNKGYRIVNLDQMSLLEQFFVFVNASHVAGIKGSNLFNAVFCDEGTEIIQINTQNWWHYEFETYFKNLGLNLIDLAYDEAMSLPEEHGVRIDVEVIMNLLKEKFKDQDTFQIT